MEENKYICPKCGAEMVAIYEKPALNLSCPKCGCKLATTKWDKIDLDDTDYEIILASLIKPSMNQIKLISNMTGKNYIASKKILETGGLLLTAKAIDAENILKDLNDAKIKFHISPNFPY